MFRKLHHLRPAKDNARNEIAVLIHGLFLRGINMYSMGRFLRKNGYEVYIYDYWSTRKKIVGHGVDFKNYLKKIFHLHPDAKVNIVTHSMGGIVTREAVSSLENEGCSENLKRIVMLAPPNKGSDVARDVVRALPFARILAKPLPELSSAPYSYIHDSPIPDTIEIGIVAGKYDGKVFEKYTHLNGQKDHIVVPSRHTFIMHKTEVQQQTLHFLENGSFF